jgi:putative ABC transport system substrate-binding protein
LPTPLQPSAQLARSSSSPHPAERPSRRPIRPKRAAVSHLFAPKRERDVAHPENRVFAGVLERGAGLIDDPGFHSCPRQRGPIVHPNAIDPVESGLVTSLAHPGGNVTGLAVVNAELSAKRVEIFKQLLPRLARAAVLWNVANPGNALAWRNTEHAARVLGVDIKSHELRDSGDFDGVFATIAQERPDGLLVLQDALTLAHRKLIIDFTLRERIPSMFVGKEWAQEGGLISYGDLLPERYRLAASIVDKILKGAQPADIPVSQPMKLVINLKTAKALDITVPLIMQMTADEVIE